MEQNRKLPTKFIIFMLALVCLICVAIRIYKIDELALWADEVLTLKLLEQNTISGWLTYQIHDASPPFGYLILKAWTDLGGSTLDKYTLYLRILPIIFSLFTIIAIFVLTKRIGGFWVAIFAALIFATHPFSVYYGREIRHNIIYSLFAVLTLYALIKLIKNPKFPSFFFYFLSASMLMWTHYYAIFLIFPQLVLLFFILKGKRFEIIALGLAIALSFVPWLGAMEVQWTHGQPREGFPVGLEAILSWVFYTIGGSEWEPAPIPILGLPFAQQGYFLMLILFTLPFLIALVRGLRKKEYALVTFSLIVPILLSIVASIFVPIYRPKYLFMYFPFFCILLSAGLFKGDGKLRAWLAFLLFLVTIASLMQIYYRPEFERERWDQAAKWVTKNESGGERCAVAFYSYYPGVEALKYYYRGRCKIVSLFKSPYPQSAFQRTVDTWQKELAKNYDVIWLVDYLPNIHDCTGAIKSAFMKTFRRVDSLDFASQRFNMFAFASTKEKWAEFISPKINFEKGGFLNMQIVDGVKRGEQGEPAWLAPKSKVILGYQYEDSIYLKLLPPFELLPEQKLGVIVKVEGVTVIDSILDRTKSSYLAAFIPGKYNKKAVEVEILFDRAIIGSESTGSPESILISEIGLNKIGCEPEQ